MTSRRTNTLRNLFSGLFFRVISVLLPFLTRTAMIRALGSEYVGLTSLFVSILQVMNLAELGFSSAVIFNMYKPIANKDYLAVNALLNLYKNVYRTIGVILFVSGIILLPFLGYFIKGGWPSNINIQLLFLFYLADTSMSYFLFAYRSALLNALQRMDLVNMVQSFVSIAKYTLQLIALISTKSLYIYMTVSIASTIISNLITADISKRRFPEYFPKGKVDPDTQESVKKQVGGLMIGKLSDTSRNSFDSVILSSLFGLTTVAIYNNYYYIFTSIYGTLLIVMQAMQASVGNSIVVDNVKKNYRDMIKFQFLFSWISILCTACLVSLYQPFMTIWAGKGLLLSTGNMVLFCFYFYAININNVRNLYFTGNGLWWDAKLSFVAEAIANLILNFALGYLMGVTGVLLATIITIIVFNFVNRTNILFRHYFQISPRSFYLQHIGYLLLTVIICAVTISVNSLFHMSALLTLIVRTITSLIIPNVIMLALFFRTRIFRETLATITADRFKNRK